MKNFAQGFLSEPFDEVRCAVRKRYAGRRNILMRLNEQCVAAQHEISINRYEPRELLGGALFARTLASSQAAIIMLEHGLLSQAKVVLRSALEYLFALAAIEAKPELAVTFTQSIDANKRSLADQMLQCTSGELRDALSAEQFDEARLREIRSSKASGFNVSQLADAAGMMHLYHSVYPILSFATHVSIVDLIDHVVVDDYDNVTELKNEPEMDDQESVWEFAIEIQINAAKALHGIFMMDYVDIETYKDELQAIAGAI